MSKARSQSQNKNQNQNQPAFVYRVGHTRRVIPSAADNGERNTKNAQRYLDALFLRGQSLPNVHVLDRVVDIPTIIKGFRARLRKAARSAVRDLKELESDDDVRKDMKAFRAKYRDALVGVAGLNLARSCHEYLATIVEELVLRVVLGERSAVEDSVKAVEDLCDSIRMKKKDEDEDEKSRGSEHKHKKRKEKTNVAEDS